MNLQLFVEVAGCPTMCAHCWAQGVPYNAMPLEDVRLVLEEARRFCDERGLALEAFPMHEVAAHPDALAVMQLFRDAVGHDPGFEPIATTGVPLVMRPDWRELLQGIAAAGTRTVWVAFHGLGADHDAVVHRPGAFEETCEAVRRVRALGMRCGANIFVTRPLLARLPELLDTLDGVGLDEESWEPPAFYPNARLRRHEALRPTFNEARPHAPSIAARSVFWKGEWAELETYTEARWRERVLAGEWDTNEWWTERRQIELVVRPNLDVFTGKAGLYRDRHGNLRRDGASPVLERALRHGARSNDELFTGGPLALTIVGLAERAGDPQGQTLDFHAYSVRYRWADRIRARV